MALFLTAKDKTLEAKEKFEEIKKCTYTPKNIGSSNQQEFMTCDCQENWDSTTQSNHACGEDSNCINRVTSVECINGHCLCGSDCQNQRFQKKQYSPVSVFQTELKGYGLRADAVITESSFIYEYIGEVIDEPTFRGRMIDYDKKNFKHFYFMMLKGDSFIDATVKGSLARFCNHSCNPNAYVDKWVVGDKLRMGIFAKRTIQEGEEITFDYNVDRYGAQSQPCYCGEDNCVKFMGGKTQTDAALLLPDGISEALGVTAKQEKQWLKENKHLRSKQQGDDAIINEMFIKTIEVEELAEQDVSKLMGALMKPQETPIVHKLVERIYMTNDEYINSLIIKFHGYKALSTLIKEFKSVDDELVEKILVILTKWPKVTRNKISSSQIENVVKDIESTSDNSEIKELAANLLGEWGKLQMAYRIPKTKAEVATGYGRKDSKSPRKEESPESVTLVGSTSPGSPDGTPLPDGWETALDPNTNSHYYFHRELNLSRWDKPTSSVPTGPKSKAIPKGPHANGNGHGIQLKNVPKGPSGSKPKDEKRKDDKRKDDKRFSGDSFAVKKEEERLRLEKEELYLRLQEREKQLQELIQKSGDDKKKELEEKKSQEKSKKKPHHKTSSSTKKAPKKPESLEAKWTHVLAKHIPNVLKKYEAEIGRDNVKGCAKDIVKTLVAKELKKEPSVSPPGELESHKLKKIKEYCTIFMDKFLVKYRLKHDKKRKSDSKEDQGHKRAKTEQS